MKELSAFEPKDILGPAPANGSSNILKLSVVFCAQIGRAHV